MPRKKTHRETIDLSHIAEPLQPLAVPISSLTIDPANARTHDRRNIDAIKASLKAFGLRKPVVVRKDGMIVEAGNGTVQAALELAEDDPRWNYISAVPMDDDGVIAASYAIADNRTAELAGWDQDALTSILHSIQKHEDIALESIGFHEDEVADLLASMQAESGADDEVPEAPKKPVTKRGDVWIMGDHRLLCGDGTSIEDVNRLAAGEQVDLCVTSPPYNVGLCYLCITDKLPRNEYLAFISAIAAQVQRLLKPGRFIAWNLGVSPSTYVAHQVVELEKLGFRFYRQIIWAKTGVRWPAFASTRKMRRARKYSPNYSHEVVEIMVKPGGDDTEAMCQCPLCEGGGEIPAIDIQAAYSYDTVQLMLKGSEPDPGGEIHPLKQYANDVWRINQSMATRDLKTIRTRRSGFKKGGDKHCTKEHPATFPVELPRALMAFLSAAGEIVYDPFCGTGSTIVAAQRMNRRCFGMELVPEYCDIAVRRWEQLTGEKAERVKIK